MTVPAYTGPNTSTANGVTTTFPYSFKILAASDLLVTVNGLVRTLNLHYTVTGVGEAAGGNVEFVDPPTSGAIVDRRRAMPFTRAVNYTNLGDLLAPTLNDDQDSPVLMIQQLAASVLQLVLDPGGSGEFVWDAQGNRIIRVGDPAVDADAVNLRSMYTYVEQVLGGGSSVGVTPLAFEFTGDGLTPDMPVPGADVTEPAMYDVYLETSAGSGDFSGQRPVTDYTAVIDQTDVDNSVLRFTAIPGSGVRGFAILRGYARPYTGPAPITTTAMRVVVFDGTALTIDHTYQNALIVCTDATGPVVITVRKNTGDANLDWRGGEFFSVCQRGTGKVQLAIQAGGDLQAATDFSLETRSVGSIISASCLSASADTWRASGDLLRAVIEPTKQVLRLIDRSVLIGTNIATGTVKDSFVLPYDFQLDTIANRGLYANLAVAQAAGTVVTVDVKVDGVSILATLLTFDNNEKSTLTAATPPVFSSAFLTANRIIAAGSEVTFDVTQIGTALAKGLALYLRGARAN